MAELEMYGQKFNVTFTMEVEYVKRPQLYFMVGLPRSGKSTLVKTLKKEIPNLVVVSGDKIRLAVYNQRFWAPGEATVHSVKQTMARTLLAEGYNVLIDDTNTSWKSIETIWEIDASPKYIIVDTPPHECIERAEKSNQKDLVPVISRMSPNFSATVSSLRKVYPKSEYKIGN